MGQVRRLRKSKRLRVAQRTYHQALADNLRHFRRRRQTVPHVGHIASPRTSNTSGWLVSGCTRRRGRPEARYCAILQARQRFFMQPERQRPRRQSSVALARVATKRHIRDVMDYLVPDQFQFGHRVASKNPASRCASSSSIRFRSGFAI